jgi:hypothetical protein
MIFTHKKIIENYYNKSTNTYDLSLFDEVDINFEFITDANIFAQSIKGKSIICNTLVATNVVLEYINSKSINVVNINCLVLDGTYINSDIINSTNLTVKYIKANQITSDSIYCWIIESKKIINASVHYYYYADVGELLDNSHMIKANTELFSIMEYPQYKYSHLKPKPLPTPNLKKQPKEKPMNKETKRHPYPDDFLIDVVGKENLDKIHKDHLKNAEIVLSELSTKNQEILKLRYYNKHSLEQIRHIYYNDSISKESVRCTVGSIIKKIKNNKKFMDIIIYGYDYVQQKIIDRYKALSSLKHKIDGTCVSLRLLHALNYHNIYYAEQLTTYTKKDLYKLEGIGMNMIKELQKYLDSLNLTFFDYE